MHRVWPVLNNVYTSRGDLPLFFRVHRLWWRLSDNMLKKCDDSAVSVLKRIHKTGILPLKFEWKFSRITIVRAISIFGFFVLHNNDIS